MSVEPTSPVGRYTATITSFRGRVFRVYLEDADDVSPPGYRFWLTYSNVPTGGNVKLWPLDVIPPVRKALAERRDIDMRESGGRKASPRRSDSRG